MTATHNAVKENHYYLHEVFGRTWEILSHLYGEDDLKKMGLKEDFDWSAPPPKKFKKVKVPSSWGTLQKIKNFPTVSPRSIYEFI